MSNSCPRDSDITELQGNVAAIEKSLLEGRDIMNALKVGQEKHEEHIIELLRQMTRNNLYEKERFDSLMIITETNSSHIGQVSIALEQLTKDTAGLVSAWEAGEGVVKFASVLGKLGKWVASIAFIGTFYLWVKEYF